MNLREEITKEFNKSELKKRIDAVELSAINHGFPEWHGETIQDFLNSSITSLKEELIKKIGELEAYEDMDASYKYGYDKSLADIESLIKELI